MRSSHIMTKNFCAARFLVVSAGGVSLSLNKEATLMKKLFMVAAIFSVVMISSTAFAANWVEVCTSKDYVVYVEKD